MMAARLSEEPDLSTSIPVSRVVCDFFIVLAMAIPLALFHEFVKPYKRGFYCDDETIRYPYKDSTVPTPMLVVIGLSVPVFIIIAVECYRALAWERKCQDQFKTFHFRRFNVHRMAVRLYCFLGYFLLGALFNQWIIDITKYTIGRQRPHFMHVCRPTVGFDTCLNPDQYITDFECRGPLEERRDAQRLVKESMLSFYSGHSAFSFYAAWFTVLYLQARLFRPVLSRLFLPFIQFILLAGAAYISLTRISDYKHHWSDVLVGAIMGTLIGNFVALFVAEVFKRREIPPCEIDQSYQYGLIRAEKGESIPISVLHGQQTAQAHKINIANEENDDLGNQRLSTYSFLSYRTANSEWNDGIVRTSLIPPTVDSSSLAEYLSLRSSLRSFDVPDYTTAPPPANGKDTAPPTITFPFSRARQQSNQQQQRNSIQARFL